MLGHSDSFPAYILCGGRSQRFGSDKARALVDGQPQLLHLSHALQRAGHSVHYVADRADRYNDLGIACLVDEHPECGPLAGLSSALKHRAAEIASRRATAVDLDRSCGWLLLVSCDQTAWDSRWFAELQRAALAMHDALAAAYVDTAWQPLPALFHVDLAAEVERRLLAGRLSLQQLLSQLDAEGRCAKQQLANAPPSAWSFNTPDELIKLSKQ